MPPEVSAFLGLLGGIAIGAAYHHIYTHTLNPYGAWLGRECWVRPCGKVQFARHVIVAVSWRGAVCVRDLDHMDEDGYWIKKQNVRWRIRWDRPREDEL